MVFGLWLLSMGNKDFCYFVSQADVPKLAMGYPSLLIDFTVEEIKTSFQKLQSMLPDLNLDVLVEQYPVMLDIHHFEEAVRDAHRMMKGVDIQELMVKDPGLILSLQKGSNMIPYDEVPTGNKTD